MGFPVWGPQSIPFSGAPILGSAQGSGTLGFFTLRWGPKAEKLVSYGPLPVRGTFRGTHGRGPLNLGSWGALGSLRESLGSPYVWAPLCMGATFRFP